MIRVTIRRLTADQGRRFMVFLRTRWFPPKAMAEWQGEFCFLLVASRSRPVASFAHTNGQDGWLSRKRRSPDRSSGRGGLRR
jgi:hypothetical protein